MTIERGLESSGQPAMKRVRHAQALMPAVRRDESWMDACGVNRMNYAPRAEVPVGLTGIWTMSGRRHP